jgi:hypothetical protein
MTKKYLYMHSNFIHVLCYIILTYNSLKSYTLNSTMTYASKTTDLCKSNWKLIKKLLQIHIITTLQKIRYDRFCTPAGVLDFYLYADLPKSRFIGKHINIAEKNKNMQINRLSIQISRIPTIIFESNIPNSILHLSPIQSNQINSDHDIILKL